MNRTMQGIGYAVGALALGASAVVSLTATVDPPWLATVVMVGVGIAAFLAPSIRDFFANRTRIQ